MIIGKARVVRMVSFLAAGLLLGNLATGIRTTEAAVNEDKLILTARSRTETPEASGDFMVQYNELELQPSQTAIIICDMWDRHWCKGATRRVAEMAPRMNEVISIARDKGVLIIHAPSGTVEHYTDHPARRCAQNAPKAANLPKDIGKWCRWINETEKTVYPIDQSDGGCDCQPKCEQGSPWRKQIETLQIRDEDAISDSGVEIWNLLEHRGIDNVILMGVHTNMCVLGRPFGLRNMARYGKNVFLMRDLTDTMYNSRMHPFVSHFTGTDLIIEHIEKLVCPTIASTAFMGRPQPACPESRTAGRFRFKNDKRPHVVFISAEGEYKAAWTLPKFASELEIKYGLSCEILQGSTDRRDERRHNIPGMEALTGADLAVVFVRRRALPPQQMKYFRDYMNSSRPLVALRTASHAFDARGEAPAGYLEWPKFDSEVLGGNYHGHYGSGPICTVTMASGAEAHPILAGVQVPFISNGSLYEVRPLTESTRPLLIGTIPDKEPEPVAWANTYKKSRVFYTSLGHPDDFKNPQFRRLLVNAIFWAMDKPSAGNPEVDRDAPENIAQLIRMAGTTHDEMERFQLLRQLRMRADLDTSLRGDLEKLLPIVDEWANGKDRVVVDTRRAAENGYLCRFITRKVMPESEGPLYPPAMSKGSLLHPIWCLYRGRMLIWRVIQSGPLRRVKESRDAYYDEGRRLLKEAQKAFPENRVVRMYLGEPIPCPLKYEALPQAPEWANLQREGLEKLTDIIHWWIVERQLPDGQFGGGWGDDVEMWRWWTPVLIAFDDLKANEAQERLSNGIFRQPHLKTGFTSRMTDVEHSNEDTTDTILPMMHLKPDDPLWKQRALRLAELMRDRWTGRNQRGFTQFKSIYFSVDKVDTNPGRAFDTVYHPSAVQPALLYWQRTGDPALNSLFCDWLKVWVDAAARCENGKPVGILPSTIHWPDGKVAAPGHPWWQPFSLGHNDALYNWPGATRLMTSTLVLAYHMTGDEKYMEPIHSMAAIRLRHRGKSSGTNPGSEQWCAENMGRFLPDALAKYRFLTGDAQYDTLLRADASGYVKYRLTGDTKPLINELRRNAEAFSSNWEAYTSEMRWTDRVISFTRNYLQYLPAPAPPSPSPEILYTTITGDPGNPLVFPLNAVRWLTTPRQIASLVTDSSSDRFEAELFHFGNEPRTMGVELYLLKAGQYTFRLVNKTTSKAISSQPVNVSGQRARIRFELPPKTLCILKVQPGEK